MRFDVLTLFPELFSPHLTLGVMGRAIRKGLVMVHLTQIRDFARGAHKTTDDRPFGGGNGMVMKPGPLYRALSSVPRLEGGSHVLLMSPQGERFHQTMAWDLSRTAQIIVICGRYEGIDERLGTVFPCREVSIGDYVMSGGEPAAIVLMDTVIRLLPQVLGGEHSNREDSFEDGLLEYPHYTRPRVFLGREVPDVLLSGDHERIRKWRRKESLRRTLERRPDLLSSARLTEEDKGVLVRLREERTGADAP